MHTYVVDTSGTPSLLLLRHIPILPPATPGSWESGPQLEFQYVAVYSKATR